MPKHNPDENSPQAHRFAPNEHCTRCGVTADMLANLCVPCGIGLVSRTFSCWECGQEESQLPCTQGHPGAKQHWEVRDVPLAPTRPMRSDYSRLQPPEPPSPGDAVLAQVMRKREEFWNKRNVNERPLFSPESLGVPLPATYEVDEDGNLKVPMFHVPDRYMKFPKSSFKKPACECGGERARTTHSDWCPMGGR